MKMSKRIVTVCCGTTLMLAAMLAGANVKPDFLCSRCYTAYTKCLEIGDPTYCYIQLTQCTADYCGIY